MNSQGQVAFKKSFEETYDSKENFSKSKNKKKNNKNSSSRTSTKESVNMSSPSLNKANGDISSNSQILELIESLREKIGIYQQEIGNLLDEKVQMQMTINKLQESNYSQKASSTPAKNTEEINNELDVLNTHIQRQKKILDKDHSILNETINEGVIEHTIAKKSLQDDIVNLNLQRDNIYNDIKILKDELTSLVELQEMICNKPGFDNNSNINNNNSENKDGNTSRSIETIKHDEKIIPQTKNSEMKNIEVNINSETLKTQIADLKISSQIQESEISIPKIEGYFVLNGKISLIDSEHNLWHLTKCHKYEIEKNETTCLDKEKFLSEFLIKYQNISISKRDDSRKNTLAISEIKTEEYYTKNCVEIENEEKNEYIKQNKSNFDSLNLNNMTTHCTQRYSDKNYDSLGFNHNDQEMKLDKRLDEEIIDESDLDLNLENNESLILSESN